MKFNGRYKIIEEFSLEPMPDFHVFWNLRMKKATLAIQRLIDLMKNEDDAPVEDDSDDGPSDPQA